MINVAERNVKGGRGKKASYDTCLVRVPVPVKDAVNQISENFRSTGEIRANRISYSDALLEVDSLYPLAFLSAADYTSRLAMLSFLKKIYH